MDKEKFILSFDKFFQKQYERTPELINLIDRYLRKVRKFELS